MTNNEKIIQTFQALDKKTRELVKSLMDHAPSVALVIIFALATYGTYAGTTDFEVSAQTIPAGSDTPTSEATATATTTPTADNNAATATATATATNMETTPNATGTVTPAPTITPTPQSVMQEISVHAEDSNGAPVSGVVIEGKKMPTLLVTGKTDSNGNYEILSYDPNTTDISLEAVGPNDAANFDFSFAAAAGSIDQAILANLGDPNISAQFAVSLTHEVQASSSIPDPSGEVTGQITTESLSLSSSPNGIIVQVENIEGQSSVSLNGAPPSEVMASSAQAPGSEVIIYSETNTDGFDLTIKKAGTIFTTKIANDEFSGGTISLNTQTLGINNSELAAEIDIDGDGTTDKEIVLEDDEEETDPTHQIFLPAVMN